MQSPFPTIARLLLAVSLAVVTPCSGMAAAEDEALHYAFRFDGIPLGDVLLTLHQTDTDYRGELHARAVGVLRIFGDFRANLNGSGRVTRSPDQPLPNEFNRIWYSGSSASDVTVTFDPSSRLASARERLFNPQTGKDLPPNPRHHVKVLPDTKRTDVFDPVTGFIVARAMIRANWNAGRWETSFRLPIYDGRHRYDVVITPGPVRNEKLDHAIRRVVPVTARVEPAGGFEADMAKHTRQSKGWVIFSADDRFVPLKAWLGNSLGTGVFKLINSCRDDPAPCDELIAKSKIP